MHTLYKYDQDQIKYIILEKLNVSAAGHYY